jgi:hypothetical protein
MSNRIIRAAVLLLALSAIAPAATLAAPTPKPMAGGANQIAGISGGLGSTFFNGKLRFKKFTLRTSTAAEDVPGAGKRALTLSWVVLNGVPKHTYGNIAATIVDADGVTISGSSVGVYGAYYDLLPGAGAKGSKYFEVPVDFVPVKIILTPGDGVALRINLKPSDLPAAPAPSPSASPAS